MATDHELIGGQAQAQRLERVAVQLDVLLRQPGTAERVHTLPAEGEWSVLQVLGHLAEMIPYWMDKCCWLILAAGEVPVFGRSHEAAERLAGVARGATGELAELLPLVEDEIQAAVQAICGMSPEDRARKGIHIRYGEMNVAQVIERFIVAHAEEHLAQIRVALSTSLPPDLGVQSLIKPR